MDNDNYTRIPNKVLDELYKRKFSPIQSQVLHYIIRKTYGFNKVNGDTISITKMANDIGRYREDVSKAVKLLEDKGILSVSRTGNRIGNGIKINDVKEWKLPVVKTPHVGKLPHVGKTPREVWGNHHATCGEITTHKRNYTKYTLQKKNPYNPLTEIEDEDGEPFPDDYWEEP